MHIENNLFFFFILMILILPGCNEIKSGDSENQSPTVLPVSVINVNKIQEFSYPITYYGRVQARRRSLLSFEIPGKLLSLEYDEGDLVDKDKQMAKLDISLLAIEKMQLVAKKNVEKTILLRLENGEREETIEAAVAIVNRTKAETNKAEKELERIKKLRKSGVSTDSEYDEALYRYKALEAACFAEEARLKELQTGSRKEDIEAQKNRIIELDTQIERLDIQIEKATLKSPYNGYVIKRLVDEGVVIKEGDPVFEIAELSEYEARFSIPVNKLSQINRIEHVSIGKSDYPVTNVRTVSDVSDATRTVDIVLELRGSDNLIKGQTCILKLEEVVKGEYVKLPVSTLAPSVRGLWFCYRLQELKESSTYKLIREEVAINHTDGNHLFVETSLPENSLIVANGVHKLVPGMVVQIKEENR